jgi:GTP diphosphokinase / guanosine-3',5'-bis(diphosphate) 3'-diphosphatase
MSGIDTQLRVPRYRLFFSQLVLFSPNDYESVQFAYFISKYGHEKQVRKDGSRYFDHPKAAAWIYINELGGRDSRVIIDILLHDIREDTYLLSPYRAGLNFGEEIALDVSAVTKLPNSEETVEENVQRIIERGPWAIITKLCDRLHNIRTLGACSPEEQKQKIAETEQYHLPLLTKALKGYGGDWEKYSGMLSLKMKEAIANIKKNW